MSTRIFSGALAIAIAMGSTSIPSAYAQSPNTVVVPVTPAVPVVAERRTLPNPALLGSGVATLAIGYIPAVIAGIASDHKGDNDLFIPVVGPWLDLGKRECSGATVSTANGPFEVSSQSNCGTSGIETAALITDGVVQGLGALQILGSLFVPARRVAVVATRPRPSSFAVMPTSFGGKGAGAVAAGRF